MRMKLTGQLFAHIIKKSNDCTTKQMSFEKKIPTLGEIANSIHL